MRGVKKIWDRLNHKYGRPEVIQSSLKAKLLAFPKMSVRDYKKLFDRADLLREIESVKRILSTALCYPTLTSPLELIHCLTNFH